MLDTGLLLEQLRWGVYIPTTGGRNEAFVL